MDAFVSRKRRKLATDDEAPAQIHEPQQDTQSTDEKLAILASVFEDTPHNTLLETLIANAGSVEDAINSLLTTPRKSQPSIQSALAFAPPAQKQLTRKGKTLYLFDAASIAHHTPCSIIHNFLPPALATDLLHELLPEAASYTSASFRLFDRPVQSPHTACFYVSSLAEAAAQRAYLYNGSSLSDVREILPVMRRVSALVETAVNAQIAQRIAHRGKLPHQPAGHWVPNAAFVNCYDGPQQSVGYHTDQLTYLGPHPTIGSLSLGVQREFTIRRIVPAPDLTGLDPEGAEARRLRDEYADAQGQISLPLPHNSLLVMHAEMQEEWKHSIAVAGKKDGGITPHPVAGRKRLNITYRWYRDEFRPEHIPNCKCGVPTVLKSVMRREATRGKYVWMCQTASRVDENETDGKGCGFFEWAEFDDDGVPIAKSGVTAASDDAEQREASCTNGVPTKTN